MSVSIPVLGSDDVKSRIDIGPDFHWAACSYPALVLSRDENDWAEMKHRLSPIQRAAMPLLSLEALPCADGVVAASCPGPAMQDCVPLARRMMELRRDIFSLPDERLGLIAYLEVRDKDLCPESNPTRRQVLEFSERSRFPGLDALTEGLESDGLLKRCFFERVNTCPHCQSARLLVRDQCPHCSSSDISNQVILHHYRCACQMQEEAFHSKSGELRCPKCRQLLEQVSFDYEVSASLCNCRGCGGLSNEAVAGYRCIDCGNVGQGNQLAEFEAYSFSLTAAAREILRRHVSVKLVRTDPHPDEAAA
jgi:hypothetical protein